MAADPPRLFIHKIRPPPPIHPTQLRPKPYEGLRLQVDKDLAVLLMRSSYQVADELDFIGMDEFQKVRWSVGGLYWGCVDYWLLIIGGWF